MITMTATSGASDRRLISLENNSHTADPISPFSSIHDEKFTKSESLFHNHIDHLKKQSNKRFKDKWDEILQKYSQIDDEKESDEIDLITGKITVDNGHLKSLISDDYLVGLTSLEKSIWSEDYSSQNERRRIRREEQLRANAKHKLKEELKQSQSFYNTKVSPFKPGTSDVPSDAFLELSPSPTKKQRNSPSKFSSIYSKENSPMSLLRRRQPHQISPSKLQLQKLTLASENEEVGVVSSGEESDSPFLAKRGEDRRKTRLFKDLEKLITVRQTSDLEGGVELLHTDEEDEAESEAEIEAEIEAESEAEIEQSDNSVAPEDEDDYLSEPEFEVEYTPENTIDMSVYGDDIEIIYDFLNPHRFHHVECPFSNCKAISENEHDYRTHLLTYHASKLKLIGYPVNTYNPDVRTISKNTKAILLKQFPLTYDTPPLPATTDLLPLRCQAKLKRRYCRKVFLSSSDLDHHLDSGQCSSKRQFFASPFLGCTFVCEGKYLAWRKHIIDTKRGADISLSNEESNEVPINKTVDVRQEIEDLFRETDLCSDH